MSLILFFGLITAVLAFPQSYNYQVPSTFTLSPPQSNYLRPQQQYFPPPISQFSPTPRFDFSPPFPTYNSFTSRQNNFESFHSPPRPTHNYHHQAPIITKHFYFHSAPEEYTEPEPRVIRVGTPRRSYRVIFIKAPTHSGRSSISVVPQQNEERTVIYILTKQTDASDIKASVQNTQSRPSKPEVFFIKYKTQEEALHAQHKIQAQFETLGGTTQISNEGTVPVSSVVGSTGASNEDNSKTVGSSGSRYLPPLKKKKK